MEGVTMSINNKRCVCKVKVIAGGSVCVGTVGRCAPQGYAVGGSGRVG